MTPAGPPPAMQQRVVMSVTGSPSYHASHKNVRPWRRTFAAKSERLSSLKLNSSTRLRGPPFGHPLGMPKKHRYSAKEHRQVEHIKDSKEARCVPAQEAEAIGYATVSKQNPGKHRHTAKERRQIEHIIESEEARGKSDTVAKRIGYATVNKRAK